MEDHGEKVSAIIPLNLDGFIFSDEWQNLNKVSILSRYVVDFSDSSKFEGALEKLALALQAENREAPPTAAKL